MERFSLAVEQLLRVGVYLTMAFIKKNHKLFGKFIQEGCLLKLGR